MSARGEENSSFRPKEGESQRTVINREMGEVDTKSAYIELIEKANIELDKIKIIVSESRGNWVKNNIELLKSIQVPKILFWFSKRTSNYQEEYSHIRKLFSSFPQLVNKAMVDSIKPYATEYI